MKTTGQHIVIIGAGESGVGAALLAKAKGHRVFVSDGGVILPSYRDELNRNGIAFESGKHTAEELLQADVLIKSPGVPTTVDIVQRAIERQIPVLSEIEFAARYTTKHLIGITGSNGKTTTTTWIHHLLRQAGRNAVMAGNSGQSLARQVVEDKADHYVVELSSFQLEETLEFRPNIAALLNITPDHLDRYDNRMQQYVDAKFKLTQQLTPDDWFIYNADDPIITAEIARRNIRAKRAPFSVKKIAQTAGYIDNELLSVHLKTPFTMSIHNLALKGNHNVQNALVTAISAKILDIRNEKIRASLTDFKQVPHRLESVAKVDGIHFINDSKATNVNATWYALESMEQPTVWIVGGVDKGNDYDTLVPLVREKVKAIVCLGKDTHKIKRAFSGTVAVMAEAQSALEAVALSYQLAKENETVLLSPACASFDLFDNYEDRGNQFKTAVRAL